MNINLIIILIINIFGLAGFVYIIFNKQKLITNYINEIQKLSSENKTLISEKESLRDLNTKISIELSEEKSEIKFLKEKLTSQEINFKEQKTQQLTQFQNIANKILNDNQKQLQNSSEHQLKLILSPLKDQIQTFRKQIEKTYDSEMKERISLKEQINLIVQTNQKMHAETANLTKALKGDTKLQGNWGEVILERLLENSGLVEGQEYIKQAKDMNLKNDIGNTIRPDIIIHLPDNKHIIIDSKLSLTNYERYINTENMNEQNIELVKFKTSVKTHVNQLHEKRYAHCPQLEQPDFVLMFMPIEGAFSLAIQEDPDLFSYAWNKKIVIVSPTTLMATLKTIESIWRYEKQSKNTQKIAKQGGLLYDKFEGLYRDLENIDNALNTTQNHVQKAFNKLKTGKGNLLSQVEKLKQLGAQTNKQLPNIGNEDLDESSNNTSKLTNTVNRNVNLNDSSLDLSETLFKTS